VRAAAAADTSPKITIPIACRRRVLSIGLS
jgi:hypothetical protein